MKGLLLSDQSNRTANTIDDYFKELFIPKFDGDKSNYLEVQNKDGGNNFILWQDAGINYTVVEYGFESFEYDSGFTTEREENSLKICHSYSCEQIVQAHGWSDCDKVKSWLEGA